MAENDPTAAVLAAHLDGESVLLHMDLKRYYRLNETGQAIWRALEAGHRGDALEEALLEQFDVDPATVRTEIQRFVRELADAGLVRRAATPDSSDGDVASPRD
jgi:predicted transcriptional regulator